MTVSDLLLYTDEKNKVCLTIGNKPKPVYKGYLEDCPTTLLDKCVYNIKAIDFNEMEVALRI